MCHLLLLKPINVMVTDVEPAGAEAERVDPSEDLENVVGELLDMY